MRIAGYDVRLLDAGRFRLDGGGMFGVVPRTLWTRSVEPDEQNRIVMATNCLLLEGHGRRVLIETGCGDKLSAKDREIYGIANPGGIAAVLRDAGVGPESIDAVFVTHLHFDHGGGLTTTAAVGPAVPTFPNARVFVQHREWDDATANRSHMKTTYRPENFQPIADAGRLERLDGSITGVLEGIDVLATPGHTPGHQSILVSADGETLCFIGDLAPTRHHLRPYWTMSYDLAPAQVNEVRQELIGQAIAGRWILVLPHDPDTPAVRVGADAQGRWVSEPVSLV